MFSQAKVLVGARDSLKDKYHVILPNGVLNLGRTRELIPHRRTGRGRWSPSLDFLICCSISKRFCLQWKDFDLMGWGAPGGLRHQQQWSPSLN